MFHPDVKSEIKHTVTCNRKSRFVWVWTFGITQQKQNKGRVVFRHFDGDLLYNCVCKKVVWVPERCWLTLRNETGYAAMTLGSTGFWCVVIHSHLSELVCQIKNSNNRILVAFRKWWNASCRCSNVYFFLNLFTLRPRTDTCLNW